MEDLILQGWSKILLCVSLDVELEPSPKAALLFLDFSSLVTVSPPFPNQQLFEPALWNSGKIMEAEAYFLQVLAPWLARGSWFFGTWAHLLSRIASFPNKAIFPFTQHLSLCIGSLGDEQLNLSSVTVLDISRRKNFQEVKFDKASEWLKEIREVEEWRWLKDFQHTCLR